MAHKREIEPRARKRRARGKRAFDEILEDDERELPLGGDDKPPAGA